LYVLAVLSLLGLAVLGQVPTEVAGWWMRPMVGPAGKVRRRYERGGRWCEHLRATGGYLRQSWPAVWLRSLALWGLWAWSGRWGPGWLGLVPWGLWLWRGLGVGWPSLRQRAIWDWVECGLWQGQRLLLVGYLGLALSQPRAGALAVSCLGLNGLAGATSGAVGDAEADPWVKVEHQADGSYQATLCGPFTLQVAGDQPFRMRLLVLFLSLLDVPGTGRGSRRTRDGRMPFVRQMQMAEWFGVPQPHISRWLGWWHSGDWASLLSLHSAEVLTAELVERIVEVFATFPTWSAEQVYQHLRQQGLAVTAPQVAQAAEQSGWRHLRQTLLERYDLGGSVLRLRDDWLVGQLLAQLRDLLGQLEGGPGRTAQEQRSVEDLTALAAQAGGVAAPPVKALPWLLRVEQVVFGQWQMITDGQVRCPYCGSDQVGRKSATPRLKKYYDEAGQLSEFAVYRYYCRNPQCAKGSFTHLPPGLLPYSPYRTDVHLLAVQMYGWGYSTYRRTGTALGVASLTAWRWVSAWGTDLLPVAALFGLVKSSGVVGVDEKYVLVPKNDKPAGEMRRWMYVYLAVDVWTYDLLHIEIYAYNNDDSAQAFLLALRAKGYHPQVIVTDLRRDYGPVIACDLWVACLSAGWASRVHLPCLAGCPDASQEGLRTGLCHQAPRSRASQAADLRHLRRRNPGSGHRTLCRRARPAPGLRPDPA